MTRTDPRNATPSALPARFTVGSSLRLAGSNVRMRGSSCNIPVTSEVWSRLRDNAMIRPGPAEVEDRSARGRWGGGPDLELRP